MRTIAPVEKMGKTNKMRDLFTQIINAYASMMIKIE